MGRYYGTLLLINFCFGTVLATTLWLLGMPNAPLWGVLGGILNFVPYVGPAIGVAIVTVVALVTFPGTAHVLLVAASYVALATVEGHIVEPLFIGRRLNLNPSWCCLRCGSAAGCGALPGSCWRCRCCWRSR